ncbi:hypothetical protein [Rhodoferax sp.]|uniref:hypothetical protein n=1 Tax=Rhodoferax sp. TaxID=50421 RepID=UPI0025DBA36B|nr:hypothetical protein [Rhodoferax sp.]
MTDSIFKVSDVKSLKELAHVLTYPLIAVAYFMQSGPSIGWEDQWRWGIPESLTVTGQLSLFFIYFALKSIWVCAAVGVVDVLVTQLNWEYGEVLLAIASIVFIGVGLMGLFAQDMHPLLAKVNKFWFVACLVWGFACSGRLERATKS